MTMKKVLVLGGTGFVGEAAVSHLARGQMYKPIIGSRQPRQKNQSSMDVVVADTMSLDSLVSAIKGIDAVINCVAGDADAIALGTQNLVKAALSVDKPPRIVHLSTMSVYGGVQGVVTESSPLSDDLGWYGHAKIEAEGAILSYRRQGGDAVILRPGCIVGPNSDQWLSRIAAWLMEGRIGDLGPHADGPANLVDVADVAQAIERSLKLDMCGDAVPVFNLAAPDSPRWNDYFVDLGIAINATPVQRIGHRRLKLEVYGRGVALKIAERILPKIGLRGIKVPPSIPPSLLRLWGQQIQLNSDIATYGMSLEWTPYATSVQNAASWWLKAAASKQHAQTKAQQ
jgi:nucleoside-diphosphate-sugar epimerase